MRNSVFRDVSDILLGADVHRLLEQSGRLAEWIPELAPMIGFDQHSPHHAYDVYTHTAYVVAAMPEDLTLRWAALLHDVGKVPCFSRDANGRGHFYGHAEAGAAIAERIFSRIDAPELLQRRAVWLIGSHMKRLQPEKSALAALLRQYGREAVNQLIVLQEADLSCKGTAEDGAQAEQFSAMRSILNNTEE